MTDFIDRYEDQLLDAARARAARPAWRRVRHPSRLVLVVAAFAAAGGTAVAATQPWVPLLGTAEHPGATATTAPLSPDELALLGVLRRPQTDADRGPRTAYVLTFLGKSAQGVHPGSIRLLHADPDGRGFVLVPISHRLVSAPSLPGGTAAQRTRADRHLCVYSIDGDHGHRAGAGVSCFSAHDIESGWALASLGPRLFGLVPDDVAAVETVYADGAWIRTAVHDNFFVVSGPTHGTGADTVAEFPVATTWLDESGTSIRTVTQPDGGPSPSAG